MHSTLLLAVVGVVAFVRAQSNVADERPLLVLSASTPDHSYYGVVFNEILDFHAGYANRVVSQSTDNVLIVVDDARQYCYDPTTKHAHMLYVTAADKQYCEEDGFELRTVKQMYAEHVPADVLLVLPDGLDEVWMRDFTTVAMNADPVGRFFYAPTYNPIALAQAHQNEFTNKINAKLAQCNLALPAKSDLAVDGGNIVDNLADSMVANKRVLTVNAQRLPAKYGSPAAVVAELKRVTGYTHVAVLDDTGDYTGHADGMVAFIDTNTIAITGTFKDEDATDTQYWSMYEQVEAKLKAAFPGIVVVELKSSFNFNAPQWRSADSSCGLHVNLLLTDDFVYVPTFGHDPKNIAVDPQVSVARDTTVLADITAATPRTVIGIPADQEICRMGGSVRCLTWQIAGPIAKCLVEQA